MPLFGKSSKNPVEVVKSLREAVNALEKVDKKAEKVSQLENFFKRKEPPRINNITMIKLT